MKYEIENKDFKEIFNNLSPQEMFKYMRSLARYQGLTGEVAQLELPWAARRAVTQFSQKNRERSIAEFGNAFGDLEKTTSYDDFHPDFDGYYIDMPLGEGAVIIDKSMHVDERRAVVCSLHKHCYTEHRIYRSASYQPNFEEIAEFGGSMSNEKRDQMLKEFIIEHEMMDVPLPEKKKDSVKGYKKDQTKEMKRRADRYSKNLSFSNLDKIGE